MGADANLRIMRRAYEAFNSGDMNTLIETFDEGAVWHLPGRSSMATDYEGRDATLAYFGRLAQETGAPSGPNWNACLQMMTTAWSASSAAPRSETASTWMLATALSSSSRTAGSLTVGSTFTTSTLGTSSGRSPPARAGRSCRLAGSIDRR
jgi:SnoaL-like protein